MQRLQGIPSSTSCRYRPMPVYWVHSMPTAAITRTAGIPTSFPNNLNELTEAMLIFLEVGGLKGGGINFDAKIRRSSTDQSDLFHAHIGGMDTFARALVTADAILNKSDFTKLRKDRYASFDSGKGKEFEDGKLTLEDLACLCHRTRRTRKHERQAGIHGKHHQPLHLILLPSRSFIRAVSSEETALLSLLLT